MMMDSKEVKVENLLQQVQKYLDEGYRLVTETCVKENGGYKIIYTFEKDYIMENIHIIVNDMEVPSISGIYFCALLVENEIQDFFGLKFGGLAVDFKGRMLLGEESPVGPLASVEIVRKEKGVKE
ncbi:MAG TPA: NADH-quinone oxidoreductase subunit C [Thermoanaerobacterales bacterium]|nr:NADH-quinone oxidoreductase subunit C [Thermoanaerobacterales bacterium]